MTYIDNTDYKVNWTTYEFAIMAYEAGTTIFLYPENDREVPVCTFNKINTSSNPYRYENWKGIWAVLEPDEFNRLPRRSKVGK